MKNLKSILLSSVIVTMVTLTIGSCKKEKDSKSGPTACFTPSTLSAYMGDEIDFTNCTTEALSYEWDFGDGSHSGDFSPKHVYHYEGTYTVLLIARNTEGETYKTINIKILTTPSAAYQGWYEGSGMCSVTGSHVYTNQSIIYAKGLQGINILNFANLHYDVYATVSGLAITIPFQVIDQLEISGSGLMSSSHNSITINYQYVYAGFESDTCQSLYSRL